MIPVEALHMAREALAGAGVPVEWHVRPRLGHGIDAEGQWMAATFHRAGAAQVSECADVARQNRVICPASGPRLHIPDTPG